MLPAQFLVVHAGRKSRSILFTSRDGLEVWSGNMMQPEERGIVSLVLCPRRPGTGARWTEGLPRAYQDVCSPDADSSAWELLEQPRALRLHRPRAPAPGSALGPRYYYRYTCAIRASSPCLGHSAQTSWRRRFPSGTPESGRNLALDCMASCKAEAARAVTTLLQSSRGVERKNSTRKPSQ